MTAGKALFRAAAALALAFTVQTSVFSADALTERIKKAQDDMHRQVFDGDHKRDYNAEKNLKIEAEKYLDSIQGQFSSLTPEQKAAFYRARIFQYRHIDELEKDGLDNAEKTCLAAINDNTVDKTMKRDAMVGLVELCSPYRYYWLQYVEGASKETIARRQALAKKYADILLNDPDSMSDYNTLFHLERYLEYLAEINPDEAEPWLKKIASNYKIANTIQADAIIYLANIEFSRGNTEEALKYCHMITDYGKKKSRFDADIPDANRFRFLTNYRFAKCMAYTRAETYIKYLERGDDEYPLDTYQLPRWTNAKAFPEPQKARYTDEFVPLTSVRLELGGGLSWNSPVVRLLRVKFERFGIKFDDNASFTIKINSSENPKAPAKPQGYSIHVTADEACVNGYDKTGTTWGVVSLIQIVDQGHCAMRLCQICDWPDLVTRGFSGNWDDSLEFCLFNKLDYVFAQEPINWNDWNYMLPKALSYELLRRQIKAYADFGLQFCLADRSPMWPKLCLSDERTFQMHKERVEFIAKHGGIYGFTLDDVRYPLNPIDYEKYGKGADLDTQYVDRLYREVKAKYPNSAFRIDFCPTYYWGPHWKDAVPGYQDTRGGYVGAIGRNIAPEVNVFWTGNEVKGYQKGKGQVKWFKDLTKRKPMIWQNAIGQHNLHAFLGDYNGMHWMHKNMDFYKNDISGFMFNMHMPTFGGIMAASAQELWNNYWQDRDKYKPERAAELALDQLIGRGAYKAISPGTLALGYFDKYPYGETNANIFNEDPADIDAKIKLAEESLAKCRAINEYNTNTFAGMYISAIDWAKGIRKAIDDPPAKLKAASETMMKQKAENNAAKAVEVVKYDKAKDVLATAYDMKGGSLSLIDDMACANVHPIGKFTSGTQCCSFTFDKKDASSYRLLIYGKGDKGSALMTVELNGKKIFEGDSPFKQGEWSVQEIKLSASDLVDKDNKIVISNAEEYVLAKAAGQENLIYPFIISFAVVKGE